MILIFVLLFVATLFIFRTALMDSSKVVYSANGTLDPEENLGVESGVFLLSQRNYNNMPEGDRTMSSYYDNRAYPGAPPMITHPIFTEQGIGGKDCLQCHKEGGFVALFDAYAPVTPHPDWLNCKQCHLPVTSTALFKNSDWEKPEPPQLGQQALATSPIVMTHGLQNRENCLACHAGPAAPEEIRVTHPERINCRQCHVPHLTLNSFVKPITSDGVTISESQNSN